MGKVKVGMIKIYLLNYQITDKNILKRNVSYYCSVPQELVNLYKNEKNLVINKKLFLKNLMGKHSDSVTTQEIKYHLTISPITYLFKSPRNLMGQESTQLKKKFLFIF